MSPPIYFDREQETLSVPELDALQRQKLANLLHQIKKSNAFYQSKLTAIEFDPEIDPLDKLPFTTRAELELSQKQNPPYGANLTEPIEYYTRLHQTSGSSGAWPMRWLDTADSWKWNQRCWSIIYAAAGITPSDRLMFPFSFGPFLGFWAAFETSAALGRLSIAAGGMSTTARLRLLLDNQITAICCTPTYALRMAEVAAEENIDIKNSSVHALIVAGEPGGSIPATRALIETAWGTRVFDHSGMTETGPMAIECVQSPGGMHVIESEFIPEVIDPATGKTVADGTPGELVITNLGRIASPLIRYRTGDQVRLTRSLCACGRSFARLEGGILGRIDEMFLVRGNNVFPPAIEQLIREFTEIVEYRIEVLEDGALTEIRIDIEPKPAADANSLCNSLSKTIQDRLNFRATINSLPAGALPRFEMKAKRIVRRKS